MFTKKDRADVIAAIKGGDARAIFAAACKANTARTKRNLYGIAQEVKHSAGDPELLAEIGPEMQLKVELYCPVEGAAATA